MGKLERAARPVGAVQELQVRVACAGRTADQVLSELQRGLDEAEIQNRDPLIVLEDLALLRDSIMGLMKGLARQLVGYPRTVAFWESSGYTEAFLSVMEKDSPETHP
jgi:hypothetical protein